MTNSPDIALTWECRTERRTFNVFVSTNGQAMTLYTNVATNRCDVWLGSNVTAWAFGISTSNALGESAVNRSLHLVRGAINLVPYSNQIQVVLFGSNTITTCTNLQLPRWQLLTNFASNRWNVIDLPATNSQQFFRVESKTNAVN